MGRFAGVSQTLGQAFNVWIHCGGCNICLVKQVPDVGTNNLSMTKSFFDIVALLSFCQCPLYDDLLSTIATEIPAFAI